MNDAVVHVQPVYRGVLQVAQGGVPGTEAVHAHAHPLALQLSQLRHDEVRRLHQTVFVDLQPHRRSGQTGLFQPLQELCDEIVGLQLGCGGVDGDMHIASPRMTPMGGLGERLLLH